MSWVNLCGQLVGRLVAGGSRMTLVDSLSVLCLFLTSLQQASSCLFSCKWQLMCKCFFKAHSNFLLSHWPKHISWPSPGSICVDTGRGEKLGL